MFEAWGRIIYRRRRLVLHGNGCGLSRDAVQIGILAGGDHRFGYGDREQKYRGEPSHYSGRDLGR